MRSPIAVEPRTSENNSVTGISIPLMPFRRICVMHCLHSDGFAGKPPETGKVEDDAADAAERRGAQLAARGGRDTSMPPPLDRQGGMLASEEAPHLLDGCGPIGSNHPVKSTPS